MRVLCVYPPFAPTYWGAEFTRRFTGKRGLLPPLGLMTVAAMLPRDWEVRLVDMNVEPLEPAAFDWADVVFLSGMLLQSDALVEVARQARARGRVTVAGGAHASTSPDALQPHVDCVVVGEAEELVPALVGALQQGRAALPARLEASRRPGLALSPTPRFDLLDVGAYQSMNIQWSRGCPFNCEFCDIIEVFGRKPRHKSAAQLVRELDALRATGYRGSLFLVDDNFIGNRAATRKLLATLRCWMEANGKPFDLYTEASVNLARDDALVDAMVAAGFSSVFVGIETPAAEALRSSGKLQNTAVDLEAAVSKLVSRGLEVMGGFIVGFDSDDAAAVDRQREWIVRSAIPLAMVGLLTALPGTQLERRLAREGRLLGTGKGDNFACPNFETRLELRELLRGYARLLEAAYEPEAYFERAARALALQPRATPPSPRPLSYGLACLARSLLFQGVLGDYRGAYWRHLWRAVSRTPRRFPRAVGMAIQGEHMIRYTREVVLPRLQELAAGPLTAPRSARHVAA